MNVNEFFHNGLVRTREKGACEQLNPIPVSAPTMPGTVRLTFHQSSFLQSTNESLPRARGSLRRLCLSCEPRRKSRWLAKLAKSSHAATADGSFGSTSAAITERTNASITIGPFTVPCGKPRHI